MAIKKFTVEVTRVDEYEIEIDTDVWNQESIDSFSTNFVHAEDVEDIVMHLAKDISHQGKAVQMEGFGFVKQRWHKQESEKLIIQKEINGYPIEESQYTKGLAVAIISYEEYDTVELFEKKFQ